MNISENWYAPEDTALIIVDLQNDFCSWGRLPVPGGEQIVGLVNDMKKRFGLVVLTKDWHPPDHKSYADNHEGKKPGDRVKMFYGMQILWPAHCTQNTDGARFHKDLKIATEDLILRKGTDPEIDSYSGFFENDGVTQPRFENGKTLTETLRARGIKRVVIVGLAYDFCVGWHALDAVREGFEVIVPKDATRAIALPGDEDGAPDSEKAMDRRLEKAGVSVIDSADLPGALAGKKPEPAARALEPV